MKSHANVNIALGRIVHVNQGFIGGFDSLNGKLRHALAMIGRLILDEIGGCHEGISNGFNLVEIKLGCQMIEFAIEAIEHVRNLWE